MQIRTITRDEVGRLLRILTHAGPHGHREWALDGEDALLAMLDNPRLSIESGNWIVAIDDDAMPGYALVEPEMNIGRIIVGVATAPPCMDAYVALLHNGIERAKSIADGVDFEVQVAVRDTETPWIARTLEVKGFRVVRTVLKMQVDTEDVRLKQGSIPYQYAVRDADMTDAAEAVSVTELHNACFTGSWGFSPNTVEEIVSRTSVDLQRNGFAPIVVLEDEVEGTICGYNWITLNEGDGRVEMVGVHPRLRGKGLGWAIFNAGIKRLIQNDATTLSLDVDSQNPPARKIYESAGYRTYSKANYYGLQVTFD